jgi:hypothetical protein
MCHGRGGEDAGRRTGRERVVQETTHDRGGMPTAAVRGHGRHVTQVRMVSQEHYPTERSRFPAIRDPALLDGGIDDVATSGGMLRPTSCQNRAHHTIFRGRILDERCALISQL